MEYEDTISVSTPEGVDLEVPLAGLGSRFTARLLDAFIQTALLILLVLAAWALQSLLGAGAGFLIAAAIVASFLVVFVYDVLFEVFAGGRTPGKRRTGLRVVRESGAPVDLRSSSIRNIVRLVDEAVTLYLAGMISIVVTKRNQRLGDLAAGTLVVREPVKPEAAPQPMALPAAGPETAAWDVSAISPEELAAVRQFLERRWQIEANARSRLAWQLSEGLRGKVAGVPEQLRGEPFLEQVAAVKSARG